LICNLSQVLYTITNTLQRRIHLIYKSYLRLSYDNRSCYDL